MARRYDLVMSEPVAEQLSADVQRIVQGYTFDEPAIELGVLMENDASVRPAIIGIPLSMLNRHGLVAGATGTGKTKTLQLMAEQICAAGVPVFAADIKGDLSGIASPGQPNDKLLTRTQKIGQNWQPRACPTEFFALGGQGNGVPLRATMSSFGPVLLSKVLGLNEVQESSLGLVFHYADQAGLPMLDLKDLRAVLTHLTSDEGQAELKNIGGLSASTVGVILRTLITFADQGAEAFFGEPEFDTADLLRVTRDGRGVVSLLELPNLMDRKRKPPSESDGKGRPLLRPRRRQRSGRGPKPPLNVRPGLPREPSREARNAGRSQWWRRSLIRVRSSSSLEPRGRRSYGASSGRRGAVGGAEGAVLYPGCSRCARHLQRRYAAQRGMLRL
jgi:hypothetical protein